MSNSEFRLLPWERGGYDVEPAIPLSAKVEKRLRQFWAKPYGGRVYFRLADEDDERIWTLLCPLPAGEHDMEAFFRREVGANRVARFFCVERGFSTQTVGQEFSAEFSERFHSSNLLLFGPTSLAAYVGDDGRGWAQEWCGGPWFEFRLPAREVNSRAFAPSIWHRGWNAAGLRRALAPLAGQFAFRPFAPELEGGQTARFIHGSRAELETLYHAACTYFMPEFVKRMANDKHRWYFFPQSSSPTVHCGLQLVAESQERSMSYYASPEIVPPVLLDLMLAQHRPVGGQWHAYRNPHPDTIFNEEYFAGEDGDLEEIELRDDMTEDALLESVLRVDFNFRPFVVPLSEQIAREPSAHERMEALLTLREWLESIGEGAQISKLLSP